MNEGKVLRLSEDWRGSPSFRQTVGQVACASLVTRWLKGQFSSNDPRWTTLGNRQLELFPDLKYHQHLRGEDPNSSRNPFHLLQFAQDITTHQDTSSLSRLSGWTCGAQLAEEETEAGRVAAATWGLGGPARYKRC